MCIVLNSRKCLKDSEESGYLPPSLVCTELHPSLLAWVTNGSQTPMSLGARAPDPRDSLTTGSSFVKKIPHVRNWGLTS